MYDVYVGEGSAHRIGRGHGEQLAAAVGVNVAQFFRVMGARGWDQTMVRRRALAHERRMSDDRLHEIAGIGEGAKRDYPDVLAYNLFYGHAYPDDCTVMWAMPDATQSKRLIFMKNSDKIGGEKLVGDGFHKYKEINVVLGLRPAGKPAVLGVAAAGSTGLKMGVNDRGVAAGTNISRTSELRTRKVSTTQERAIDRVQLSRDGLEKDTAIEAGNHIVAKLSDNPMATPGNLEFIDPTLAYVIEGSYDRLAVQFYNAGIGVRTNRFMVLDALNDPDDLSSYCRLVRCTELLKAKQGRLVPEDFMEFSADHANGPGLNSICRHSPDVKDETSQSAQVVEIDASNPKKTRVWLALGKPCWAWREPGGSIALDMQFKTGDIPEGFQSGEVWKKYWTEEPNTARDKVAAAG
jgi:hypothetical protein